jgi:uncharacterized protein (TIGR03083 family)
MDTPEHLVQLIQAEFTGLTHYLHTLPSEAWNHDSACAEWEVRDVVGHLTWLAEFFVDIMARGVQGDASNPVGLPSADTFTAASFNAYLAQQAIVHRGRLGDQLLPTCDSCYAVLIRLLSRLTPLDWDQPCANWPSIRTVPVHTVLVQILQELVIHGWDIRSQLTTADSLSPESLPVLMARIPAQLHRIASANRCLNATLPTPIHYRFVLTGAVPSTHDIIIGNGTVRMEPMGMVAPHVTFYCETERFVLLIYRRLTLESMQAARQLVIEGDHRLTTVFDQWLQGA